MERNPSPNYEGCTITNIHRGTKASGRDHLVYAQVRDKNGGLLISATLDYILKALEVRLSEHILPKEKKC